ncbi:hypothetical protein [Lunatimonas salinarum]|uniref:hypothetical protein n=1 Tax=Lunatimonas salinarum TaxID=1774590 RepID=UPI001AE04E3E|nr:hypothetical protein [Lunatimonas salinarum]
MKNYLKTSKWLRWIAAGVFGVMLVFNVMISLEFEKDKTLPSLTLIELGNRAMAQGEGIYESCDIPNGIGHHIEMGERKMCFAYNQFMWVTTCHVMEQMCCPMPNNPYCSGQSW